MKKIFYILLMIIPFISKSQGIINNGAMLVVGSTAYLQIKTSSGNYQNLSNGSVSGKLILNGTFTLQGKWSNNANAVLNLSSNNGTTIFNGTSLQRITGSQSTYFKNLKINNSSGAILQSIIHVSGSLQLIAGDLDLRNYNIDLELTGFLVNETNSHRIKATNGISEGTGTGTINFSNNLAAGTYTNIGGLGLDITTSTDMGPTAISRGHLLQSSGANTSIARYFDITPQNNTGLNTTLRFYYLDAETVGQAETGFVLWVSDNSGLTWTEKTPSVIDITNNYVEKSGITSFSRWTISNSTSNPLPVELVSFKGKCTDGVVALEWSTASETNNNYFTLERSIDGYNYSEISKITAAGNSNQLNKYSFTDMDNIISPIYYRLKQSDFDGASEDIGFTNVSCISDQNLSVEIYPNPAIDAINVSFNNENVSAILINIFNSKGELIKEDSFSGNQGSICKINLSEENDGIYYMQVTSTGKQIFKERFIIIK